VTFNLNCVSARAVFLVRYSRPCEFKTDIYVFFCFIAKISYKYRYIVYFHSVSGLYRSKKFWEEPQAHFSFTYFNKYGEASKNYELIIIKYSFQFLCIISSCIETGHDCILRNPKIGLKLLGM